MRFNNWLILQENNIQDLYLSTVKAFPHTTKRQHAIDPINITNITLTPYLGVKTLFAKSIAESDSGKLYQPMILFKQVIYNPTKNVKLIEIAANDGRMYNLKQIDEKNDVLVRCNCQDFTWRFNFFDHTDRSLYGKVRKKYEATINPGSSNPLELPGLCKHLIKMTVALRQIGILEK